LSPQAFGRKRIRDSRSGDWLRFLPDSTKVVIP
jgi:hypothetical protein